MRQGELPDEPPDLARGTRVERLAQIDKGIAIRLVDANDQLAVLAILFLASVVRHPLLSVSLGIMSECIYFVYTL
ncbi:MAG TPA: hypothetical protein VKN37_06205 [Roseovarius sp.]|nr:hypothetical protein [Roseovarius sp.]